MSQRKAVQFLKPIIRYNKNFVYKGTKYPIDFNLIKNNSNYFYERRDEYENIEDIQLTEELVGISEDSIPSFISSCHVDSFEINNSNVFSLYQLSIKYEVPSLISLTEEFIKTHDKNLIFQSIQYKCQLQNKNSNEETNPISLEDDENYIANNFFDYIDNEQLFNLPISILYRIINNPKLDINQLNETNKNRFIDFLFKCLDKYKKKASVLFLNIDLENQRISIFSKLINEYSNIFDFNMISPKFLMKTTTDLLSELTQLKYNYSNSISQINQLLKQIEDEKQKQKDLFDSFKQYAQEQLKKENEKLNESFQNMKKQIEDEKQKQQYVTDSFKQLIQNNLHEFETKQNNFSERIETLESQNKQIDKKIEDINKKQNNFTESRMSDIERKIQELNEKQNSCTRDLQTLRNQISQQNGKQQSMQSSLDDILGKVSKFATREILTKI